MSDPILSTQAVTRRFGGLTAVDAISIEVNSNEIYGIVGPNGAGKSTLFNLIAGVIPPSSGRIEVLGRRIDRMAPHRRAWLGIGRTFQTTQAFPTMGVEESVLSSISGTYTGIAGWFHSARRPADRDHARKIMNSVGLTGKETVAPSGLTTLELQRLGIGLALATNAKVMLLDEPSGGLVMSEVSQLSQLIRDIRDTGITVVVIDHKMRLMMQLCDRIMVMSAGSQIALGTPKEVAMDASVQQAYLGKPKVRPVE